jgi:hypothetical protein
MFQIIDPNKIDDGKEKFRMPQKYSAFQIIFKTFDEINIPKKEKPNRPTYQPLYVDRNKSKIKLFLERIKISFNVFIGKYDVIDWYWPKL